MYESASNVCTSESVLKYTPNARAANAKGTTQHNTHCGVHRGRAGAAAELIVRVVIGAEYTRKMNKRTTSGVFVLGASSKTGEWGR